MKIIGYVVYDENGNIRGYADDIYDLKLYKDNPDFRLEDYTEDAEIIED